MEALSTRRIVKSGVIAAIYVVLTVTLSVLSYGSIQFRVAEALMLLCLFSKDYVVALTLGCFIANIFSMVGVIDTVVGTAATLFAGVCIYLSRNKLNFFTASIFPVLFNAVFVGLELWIVLNAPLVLSMIEVAIGEIVCVTIVGGLLMKALSKNKAFMSMIKNEQETI
ncbi:MAG: QueT transporter family protein [Ruminococcus sp.]|nr:QueT transporter family protein [Ruminococcus sp.]